MADSFPARELLTETRDEMRRDEMRRHLETCPACRADLAAERALREALRRSFQNAGELSPTPEFTTQVRTTLKRAARHDLPRLRTTEVLSMPGRHESVLELPNRRAVAQWAPLVLRLVVGYGFIAHGFAKLSRGPDAFAVILHAMGVPAPHAMAWLTVLIELLGGLAVMLGAFVWLASIPMAAVLFVAMLTVHLPYGFSSIKLLAVTAAGAQFGPPGYEIDLLYLACLVALALGGPGPLAIDSLVGRGEPHSRWLRIPRLDAVSRERREQRARSDERRKHHA